VAVEAYRRACEYQRIFGAFGFFGAFDYEWSLGVFASRFGGFLCAVPCSCR
jgi:hypothetical protein